MIMLIVQFALWFDARQVALASAQAGARVAREEAASNPNWGNDATTTARNYYTGLNSHLLGSLTATSADSAQDGGALGSVRVVGVTVAGPLGYSVFGWFHLTWHVSATVSGPVECFRPAHPQGNALGGACG
jgi:hypothetical protein